MSTFQNVCIFLIGLPGYGKSYQRQILFDELSRDVTIISIDDIIEYITAVFGFSYNEGFHDLIGFAQKVMRRKFAESVKYDENIIIDRTNLTVKTRKEFISKLPETYQIIAVVLQQPPSEVWRERLKRPGKLIPEDVLESMARSYYPPTYEEGFHDIMYVDYDKICDLKLLRGN